MEDILLFIQHQKITIRNATKQDAETLCGWWNDGAVMTHAGFPKGLNTTVEQIQAIIAKKNDETNMLHMIEYDEKPIGEANYHNLQNGSAEIGIKICDFSMQNKGLGTIILSLFIRYLFEALGYQKIVLDTNSKNQRAQRTYERLGFKQVRVRQNAWLDQLGVAQTAVDYELTQKDFIDHA